MTLMDALAQTMHEVAGGAVYVYPVRRERCYTARYEKWWHGWLEFGWWPKWEGGLSRPVHAGPRLRDWARGDGANPVNRRFREVEEPFPVRCEVRRKPPMGFELVGDVSWKAQPEGSLPQGFYPKVSVRNGSGDLLWDREVNTTCSLGPNDTLTVTSLTVSLSSH